MSGYNWCEYGCLGVIDLLRKLWLATVVVLLIDSQFFKAEALINQMLRRLFGVLHDRREKWIGLLSFGFFIMLFALFFIVVPNYYAKVSEFFRDFESQEVVHNVSLPAPVHHHPVVYETVMRFCIIFGLFQFFVLALRFYFRSSLNKMAETTSNIVLWLGAAYMFYLLMSNPVDFWFPFFGGIIAVIGFSLIARSLVVLLLWRLR